MPAEPRDLDPDADTVCDGCGEWTPEGALDGGLCPFCVDLDDDGDWFNDPDMEAR